MEPGAVLRPVGPRPARVYWVRRLVFLAVLVILVVLLAHACSGGDSPRASSDTPTLPTTTTTLPSPGPTKVLRCHPNDLAVTASTDATTYSADALPHLSAVVRNASDQPCRLRTAPALRTWTISSGADEVWRSADCTTSGVAGRTRLGRGKTVAYALVWNRHRSAAGCPATTPTAAPGTYRLKVTVNGVAAPTVVFHLTD
jgi:hypothetical protein